MLADVLIWGGYIALFIWLSRKGSGHDVMVSGRVGFGIQAFAYVATYISPPAPERKTVPYATPVTV